MPSFSLLDAGRGKARCVSSRGRFGMGVLICDWRFQRSLVSQHFSISACSLRHLV